MAAAYHSCMATLRSDADKLLVSLPCIGLHAEKQTWRSAARWPRDCELLVSTAVGTSPILSFPACLLFKLSETPSTSDSQDAAAPHENNSSLPASCWRVSSSPCNSIVPPAPGDSVYLQKNCYCNIQKKKKKKNWALEELTAKSN